MTVDPSGRITAIDDPIHTPNWTWTYGADGDRHQRRHADHDRPDDDLRL